jgi:hypothetical protein
MPPPNDPNDDDARSASIGPQVTPPLNDANDDDARLASSGPQVTPPPNDPNDDDAHSATILLWDRTLDDLDYYALLGVVPSSDTLDLERAYHHFALRFHPDSHSHCSPSIREALTRIFQRGVEARRVLDDPALRAQYRVLLAKGIRRLLADAAPPLDLEQELPGLHRNCRSAGAKLEAMAAAKAWQRHDLERVRHSLTAALRFDGDANADLERMLHALTLLGTADNNR